MMNKGEYIAVHCSATKPNMDIGADTIREWHVKGRGWRDIGYAYVIRRDGTAEKGRDLNNDGETFDDIGAHVRGYNSRAIGICLVGGLDYRGQPDANFTHAQYVSLADLISDLKIKFPSAIVQGHRDFPNVNKACPCFDVVSWWDGV